MKVELIAVTQYLRGDGTPEELIEHAGRVCYRSQSRGDPATFLRARLRDGHESIIEHAGATFEISGISRACSHQLVRHRLASYSQESQRYVDMSDPALVLPDAIADDARARVRGQDGLLARVDEDGHDEAVEEGGGPACDVDVAERDGVERARVDGGAHGWDALSTSTR